MQPENMADSVTNYNENNNNPQANHCVLKATELYNMRSKCSVLLAKKIIYFCFYIILIQNYPEVLVQIALLCTYILFKSLLVKHDRFLFKIHVEFCILTLNIFPIFPPSTFLPISDFLPMASKRYSFYEF